MSETAAKLGRRIPAPAVTLESQPFWEAARDGRFLIKRCNACHEPHWYPRALCPFCFSSDTVWEESPGEGEVYTFSIMRRNPAEVYAIGYVTLDEGPAVMTNFVDMAPEDLRIGMRVKVRFEPTGEDTPPAPVFGPA